MQKSYQFVVGLLLAVLCAGCSCSNGNYKFHSFTDSNSNKTYTCSSKDKKDTEIKRMCESFQEFSIVLNDNNNATINMPSISINNEKVDYKIEDGFFYIKGDDEETFTTLGLYSDNEIKIVVGTTTILLRK